MNLKFLISLRISICVPLPFAPPSPSSSSCTPPTHVLLHVSETYFTSSNFHLISMPLFFYKYDIPFDNIVRSLIYCYMLKTSSASLSLFLKRFFLCISFVSTRWLYDFPFGRFKKSFILVSFQIYLTQIYFSTIVSYLL